MKTPANKQRSIAELSTTELLERQQEIQFMGSQYAMHGCEPPEQLTHDYEAVCRELANRDASRSN